MNAILESASPKAHRVRWWIALLIVGLVAANIVRICSFTDFDGNMKTMQTMLSLAAGVGLLILWLLFLSGMRWGSRLMALGAVVLLGLGVKMSLRLDGSVNGSGIPRLAWKWNPKRTGDVGKLEAAPAPSVPSVREAKTDCPGYLGRDRRGVVEGIELERDWSAHTPTEMWRQPVGLGWSGFAVVGDCAFTQEQRVDKELVVCYELATGRVIWSHANETRFSEPMGGDGPRATPTVFEGRVYALGATGVLDCLDAATGAVVWSRDTLKETNLPNPSFGKASSPLICDDMVVVTGGFVNTATLLAYHRANGSPVWRAGSDKASYSSPMLATLAGKRQIISVNASSVTGHEPKDGRVLWEYAWGDDKWPKCAQPVLVGSDRLLLAASFNAGTILLQFKPADGGKLSPVEVWRNRNLKSEFSNVLLRDGFIYGLDDGILACLDAATGQRKWKDGRYGHGQVLLVGDVLLIQTEQGPIVLVEASPSGFHELSRLNALQAKTWNTPALAGDRLVVRNDQEAVCYRLPLRAGGG